MTEHTCATPAVPRPGEREVHCPSLSARLLLGAIFLTYFTATVLLFYFGPWVYPLGAGQGRLVVFLVAVHTAFGIGYLVGILGAPRVGQFTVPVNTLLLTCVGLDLILLFPTSQLNTGSWVPNPWAALGDLGQAYTRSNFLKESTTPYVNYVRILLAPLLALTAPMAVYAWPQLSRLTRILFGVSIVGMLALYTSMGANAGAGHWMALFPWYILAGHLSGVNRLTRRGWLIAGGVQGASVLLFALFFAATMTQRTGSFAKYGALPSIAATAKSAKTERGAGPGPRTARAGAVPAMHRSKARIAADGLAGYLTQGYYAVYLSLQEPFVPTYGVGNSMFLQRQVVRLTGDTSLLERPYPARIEDKGWNAYGYWATIYPWIASDVTFPGTVLVVLLIGFLAGRVWVDVLGGQHVLAVAFLGQLLVMLYYFPGHNRTMHSGEGFVAFWGLFFAWLLSRRRVRA
ncbi:MAG: hypothetical protein ABI051_02800 [Vicinamibacterales bacterium]